ncbi:uncharacterized protein N7483_007429 [Penicillium malachiteum]|uniref:uncharacterized protein n=1 Tax=Penicillium malachiteum TaxID=1324776 RepID=UPI002548CA26|nr:uncharacterized protein N7483_007429 [Penicillium malachiteum]KAJ5726072.1 hypothetical protein N7483_007429 [Penicillium malachiteum]
MPYNMLYEHVQKVCLMSGNKQNGVISVKTPPGLKALLSKWAHPSRIDNMGDCVESIPYIPDCVKYDTQQALAQHSISRAGLPERFPAQLSSEMVWDASSIRLDERGFVDDDRCILKLSRENLKEINDALRYFKTLDKPLKSLDPTTFPLPSLHSTLQSVSDNLHRGTGFSLVRGIPVEEYSREDNVIIYIGLSSNIASVRGRQDHQYNGNPADVMIAHITDFSSSLEPGSATSPAYTDGEVIFHTDTGNIVSLFALEEPVEGGESLIASGWRVYNELAKLRPDLVEVLATEWPIPSSKKEGHIIRRPLIYHQAPSDSTSERILIHFPRRSFSGFGAWSHSNKLSTKQAEVLDTLHFLAERFHVPMPLRKGDMQFVNNLSMLHARNIYKDGPNQRTHKMLGEIPEALRSKWDRLYTETASHGEQIFPLEPEMRSAGRLVFE